MSDEVSPRASYDSSLLSVPKGLASNGDPVDGNPYPEAALQHQLWAKATRQAETEAARIKAEWMRETHALTYPEPRTFEELEDRLQRQRTKSRELPSSLFQVWATRAVNVVLSDNDIASIDVWLVGYADSCLQAEAALMAKHRMPEAAATAHLRYLRDEFTMLVLHFKSEARRLLAARRAQVSAETEAASTTERTGASALGLLRNRAKWLDNALQARGWTARDLERHGGPDARTLRRMLAGHPVKSTVLDKLVIGLSSKGRVAPRDIPTD